MDPLPILRDLVAVNSVNPGLVPGAPGEGAAAEVAAGWMRRAGLEVVMQPVQQGRPNVIGVLEGGSAGPSLMFCGHLDTVGVDGMADPFDPRVEDGRLYGRGAQDMKGGVAAMIAAAGLVAPQWTRGRLIVAAVADEEHESLGADALVRDWEAWSERRRKPDAAIVTEPTGLAIATAHKGFAWFEIVTRGRAAHGSRPAEGRDAIVSMGRVLGALERLDRTLQGRNAVPLEGTPSLHGSIIAGGRELSSYPDRCALQMERRTVSGESEHGVVREIDQLLDELRGADPDFEAAARLMAYRPAYRLDGAHALVEALAAPLAARGRACAPVGMSFWTDAAILAQAGIPTVLFGPGGAGLHSAVEYVNVDDVYTCRDVLAEMARAHAGDEGTRSRGARGGLAS